PRRSPTASTRIDFPAPVSPVSTFKPAPNSTSAASMTAKWVIRRKRSIGDQEKSEKSNDNIYLTALLRHDTVWHCQAGHPTRSPPATPTPARAVPAAHESTLRRDRKSVV